MGQIVLSGRRGLQRDAIASGKGRNAPERSICLTEGQVILPRDVVVRLPRCDSIAVRRAPIHGTK